jgi:hypothetical protein
MTISRKRLKNLLDYDPNTGLLRWKAISSVHNYKSKIGDMAGSKTAKGYLLIMIDGKRYPAHRLIWFMVHGKWPKHLMDHKNGVKDDNRLANLREANDSQNKANGAAYRGSLSGLKGAYYEIHRTSYKKWRAVIRKNGKLKHIGYFATAKEANEAYAEQAMKVHGEFARAA